MSLTEQMNIGSYVKVESNLVVLTTQTTAAAAAAVTGQTLDRTALGRRYYSCKAAVSGKFTGLTTAATAAISLSISHSSDGTSWDTLSTGSASTLTGTTEYGECEATANLVGARRYLRIDFPAPTFSGSSSGMVFDGAGYFVFGGADTLPVA